MKTTTSQILVALFAILPTLNANELIKVSAVSEAGGAEYHEMSYANGESEETININKVPIIATQDIASLSVGEDPLVVIVELTPDGRKKMMEGTTDMKGKRIALIVDGRIQVAPLLRQAPLGGVFHISNFKNEKDAKALVDRFNNKKG